MSLSNSNMKAQFYDLSTMISRGLYILNQVSSLLLDVKIPTLNRTKFYRLKTKNGKLIKED